MKKKQSPLRKHLAAIARTVHAYVENSRYYFGDDRLNQQHSSRFYRTLWRRKAKSTKAINAARRQAQVIGNVELMELVDEIRILAKDIIYACRWFPSGNNHGEKWRGEDILEQFDSAVTRARRMGVGV